MFGSASSFRCHLPISLGLALLMAVFATVLVDAEQPGPCILGHIADQTVWLNGNLTIMFNATEGCEILNLYRNKDWVTFSQRPSNADLHTFDVPSIDERFNNATMTLRATNSSGSVLNSTEFKVYTVDNVSAVTNLSYSSNCTYTNVWWLPPYSQGLWVTDYYYELRLNGTIVESGVTVDPCVVFNLTTLPANEPGYSVSVWALAPPGNGTVTNASIVAAVAPNVSYSTDVAIVSQQAVLILDVKVNPYCPPSYPTGATIWFSCVPDYIPLTRPIHIASNGSIKEIQSDAIDTGHTNCSVTVTSDNLSDKNTSQSFIFNSTDVQLLVARPSERTGAIYLRLKLARNSVLQEIIVNITNSRGELVNTTRITRLPHKREVTMTTSILPVGVYIISVFSCYNKSFIISKTINITQSNYSSTSIPVFPSTTATSTPTTTPAVPTTNVPVIIGVVFAVLVVICVVITGVFVGVCIVLVRQHRKKDHRRLSFGALDSSSSTNYGTGFQNLCQLSADNEIESAPVLHKEKEAQAVDTRMSLDTPPATEDSIPVDKVTAAPDAVSKDVSAVTSSEPVTAIETPPMNKSKQTASSNALATPAQEASMLVLPPLLTANVVTDDVPPTAIEKQPTPVLNEPKHTASPTTLDKLPVSVQATTPSSEDTSKQLLPPPPVMNRSIPSQPSITGMSRRPSQPVLQQTVHSDLKSDQQALAIATSQSRPSLTSSDKHELPNLQALNIQETAANSPVKFTLSESPSPPPSPPAPSQYAQDLSYPTQETTYTTDDSLRPFIKPSPQLSSPSRPKPVHPVPESSTTANSLEQLIKDVPPSDPAEEDEESYLTTMGKEVSKKSKSQPYFVK